jgi:chitosanase
MRIAIAPYLLLGASLLLGGCGQTSSADPATKSSYAITFEANGGSGTMAPQTVARGATAILNANAFSKVGLFFDGWSTDSSGMGLYADRARYKMGGADRSLHAAWTASLSKNVILALTCVAENDTTSFVYNYAENIHDGRGITFGIIGFTSGTFDGTQLLKRIRNLDPSHPLCAYIPAFERIDGLHSGGHVDDVTGLGNFIADFTEYGDDAVARRAQLELLGELYWDPAEKISDGLSLKLAISRGEIYDSCVKHGESGAFTIVRRANDKVGSPAGGTDEIAWLREYLTQRVQYYVENHEDTVGSVPRVDMYRRILDSGNYVLAPPFDVFCYDKTAITITGAHP